MGPATAATSAKGAYLCTHSKPFSTFPHTEDAVLHNDSMAWHGMAWASPYYFRTNLRSSKPTRTLFCVSVLLYDVAQAGYFSSGQFSRSVIGQCVRKMQFVISFCCHFLTSLLCGF